MHHDLKLVAKYFQYVADSKKRSECRLNDRNYQVGDTITLKEGWPAINKDKFEYTGREISARITHLDDFGCQHGYVNLSLDNVGMLIVK